MANELAAVQYIDGIFRKAFNFEFEMAQVERFDIIKDLKQQLDQAKLNSKSRTDDSDNLYIQLLEAQNELKQNKFVLDKTEEEFKNMREAQEAYRDQIDFL